MTVKLELPSMARAVAAIVVAGGLLALSSPPVAHASPDTLQQSIGNLVGGPLDVILSPVVGGLTVIQNMRDIEDPVMVRVVFAVPGWVWVTGLGVGAGTIRTITGLFEAVPGVLLFPFEADLDPLMAPVERAPALVEIENPMRDIESPWVRYNPLLVPLCIPIKFGLNYTTSD
jgi:hypothetical protein